MALFTGDVDRAADAFRQELELATRHQHDLMLYEAINGLAGVAAARFEDERAARLLGAAEGTRPERHEPAIAGQLEVRVFAAARARIGDRAWQSAYAAGAALTTREAVDGAWRRHV